MSKKLHFACLMLLFLSFGIRGLRAQETAATISGTAKDESGAVLPGVTVTVRNMDTGQTRTVITDDEGHYVVPELSPGAGEVTALLTGFQTAVRTGILLTVGRHAVVDMLLKVGATDEKVVVSGEAPLVETTSSALAGLVGESQIRDLPLNGRNFVQLSLLETGVAQAVNAGSSAVVGGGLKMSFHGARIDFNNFMMDGTSINSVNQQAIGGTSGQALGVETIREFQIVTSNYSAEFGRNAGGVINVVSKSGTNELHGSVFEFLRNSALDARSFFDGSRVPPFRRNQFGFALGGPVRKDKTFVFGGYEGLREGLGQTLIANVPTAAARQGNLSSLGTVTVNPVVKPYLDLFPLPNGRDFGDGTGESIRGDTSVTRQDFYQVRVDHSYSEADNFFARYTIDDSSKQTPVAIPTWRQADLTRSQYVTMEEKRIFSPRLLNVFRFGFNRTSVNFSQEALDPRVMQPSLWYIPNSSVPGLGPLGISGIGEAGGAVNRPRRRLDNVFQWVDTVTYNAGTHFVKSGVEVQRVQTNEAETFRGQGVFSFSNLRGFLLAQPQSFIGVTADSDWVRGWRQTLFATFLQDDIRIRSNLTVNLGVRWEFVTNPSEVNGKASHMNDPTVDTATIAGNPLLKISKGNVAPRIGFVWDPFGDGKTSIRGGSGLFHQMIFRYYYLDSSNTLPPSVRSLTGQAPLLTFPNPVNQGAVPGGLGPADYDNRTPYMIQYNVSLQRELIPYTVVTLGYVGSRGLHLGRFLDPNIAIPQIQSDGRKFFAAGLNRRNPAFAQIRFRSLTASSRYNSLQLKVARRVREGLQAQGSYTWAHSLDDASGQLSGDFGNHNSIPQDPYDLRTERSSSDFDMRHVLAMNFTYDVPLGRNLTGVAGNLLRGWQVNSIARFTSGAPFTVENSSALDRDRDKADGSASRPDLVAGRGNNPVLGGADRYYDVSAFQLQAAGFYGNLGRNTLIGPGLAAFDFALTKSTAIREGKDVQFRAEFFNLFNHANFGLPNRTAFANANGSPSGSAGRITQTVTTSRQIQFGLKISF